MARIAALPLDPIRFDVANALVDVHFDVHFNQSDKDNLSDPIPGGRFTAVGGDTIRADGENELPFNRSATVARENLNEDLAHNPDEIKARVSL